ncbi:MAG: AI-2E family transporter [Thiohalocapsa sp.]|uniref:AI-2E family transporter n=1 Tax=Thiohalocapsa sp. TaxID=2497641 RepID=UPI0025D6CF8B|nr:AI-2E family transporter [Thiohalocapsa sp.]MCG6943487.1 AI-2E family transporter [Thiohalocapsa sp.]
MSIQMQFTPPARGLIIAGAAALVIALMKAAAPILAPLLLAAFIAIVATPMLRWMRRKGVPKWGALAVVVFILLDVGSLLALLTTGALEGFRDSFPTYQERFMLLSQQVGGLLEAAGVGHSQEAIPDLLNPKQVMAVVRLMLSNASGVLATGLLVLLAVIFILLEAPSLRTKLHVAFNLSPDAEARISKLFSRMNRYMQIKTLTSAATGLCIWLLLWLLGIDFAPLWGVIAFLLNFVPVVGNIVMMIPGVLMALVQTDVLTALLVAAGYLVVNTVIGNVIEPRIMGRGLGISTLAVFIALLFWGWLFGLVGMFLAVPLTATLIAALDASTHTRALAVMLGPEVKAIPASEDTPPGPATSPTTAPVSAMNPTDQATPPDQDGDKPAQGG